MSDPITEKLQSRGLELPEAPMPAANYLPYVLTGDLLHVSGQISAGPDGPMIGKLGQDAELADGVLAAEACALSLLAQARAAAGGDLGRIDRLVKLTGFVNSAPGFIDQPKVINGASDLLVEIMGDAGRHARSAVGVAELPFGVMVEIEAIFRMR